MVLWLLYTTINILLWILNNLRPRPQYHVVKCTRTNQVWLPATKEEQRLCMWEKAGPWHVSARICEAYGMSLHIRVRPMACLCTYVWGLWHVSAHMCEAYGMSLHIRERPMACLCTYLRGLRHVSAHTSEAYGMSLHIHVKPMACLCTYLRGLWHVSAYTSEAYGMSLHIQVRPMACLCIYMWGLWHVSAHTCKAYGMSLHIHVRPTACLWTYLRPMVCFCTYMSGLRHVSEHTCEAYGMSLHIHVRPVACLCIQVRSVTCLCTYLRDLWHVSAHTSEAYGMSLHIPVRPMACLCTYLRGLWHVFENVHTSTMCWERAFFGGKKLHAEGNYRFEITVHSLTKIPIHQCVLFHDAVNCYGPIVSVTDMQMIRSTDGMIRAEWNWSAWIKTCLSATSSTTKVINWPRTKPLTAETQRQSLFFSITVLFHLSPQTGTLTFLQSASRLFVRILQSHDMFTLQIKFSTILQSDHTAWPSTTWEVHAQHTSTVSLAKHTHAHMNTHTNCQILFFTKGCNRSPREPG